MHTPKEDTSNWVIIVAAFISQTLHTSILSSTGVLYVIFKDGLGGSSGVLSLATSLLVGVAYGSGMEKTMNYSGEPIWTIIYFL